MRAGTIVEWVNGREVKWEHTHLRMFLLTEWSQHDFGPLTIQKCIPYFLLLTQTPLRAKPEASRCSAFPSSFSWEDIPLNLHFFILTPVTCHGLDHPPLLNKCKLTVCPRITGSHDNCRSKVSTRCMQFLCRNLQLQVQSTQTHWKLTNSRGS